MTINGHEFGVCTHYQMGPCVCVYSLADWLWCRGDPFGTCRLDSQLRLFLTGSAAGPELERVRFGRLRRNFSTHRHTHHR